MSPAEQEDKAGGKAWRTLELRSLSPVLCTEIIQLSWLESCLPTNGSDCSTRWRNFRTSASLATMSSVDRQRLIMPTPSPEWRGAKEVSTMAVETQYKHIILNKDNVPIIEGTTMKVVELVLDSRAYGWSPEELHFQHPYLTLGQIYSGLAYYWDHQEEIDQDIERRLQQVDQIQQAMKPSPLQAHLKAKGLI